MAIDLYFAGSRQAAVEDHFRENNCNRLITYVDKPEKRLTEFENCTSKLFMDSGAFSVHNSGKSVDIDEYIEFINTHPRVTLFAALDVIPEEKVAHKAHAAAKQSLENYHYMLDHVKPELKDKIVPAYHYSEPFEYLEKMLEGYKGYKPDYIAFGGRVGTPTKHLYPSLDRFFDVIKRSSIPNVKVHGFGITVIKLIERYPFTSVDSATWLRTSINGGIHLESIDGMVMRLNPAVPNSLPNRDKEQIRIYTEEIEKYGYNLQKLTDDVNERLKYNIDYFCRLEKRLEFKGANRISRKGLF